MSEVVGWENGYLITRGTALFVEEGYHIYEPTGGSDGAGNPVYRKLGSPTMWYSSEDGARRAASALQRVAT